jgi:hypothetical protein
MPFVHVACKMTEPTCRRATGERVSSSSVRLAGGAGTGVAGAMPTTLSADAAERLKEKHMEFEGAASEMRGAERTTGTTPWGIEQHVVKLRNGHAILRWPVAYEGGAV